MSLTQLLVDMRATSAQYHEIEKRAERDLEKLRPLLIGCVVERRYPHVGKYQITGIDLAYDFAIRLHGRKITARGLGSQAWDLGELRAGDFPAELPKVSAA
jgi:hypothetical protein